MEFNDEESFAIANINMQALKGVLPDDQWNALSKFVTCMGGFKDLKEGSAKQ